MACVIILSKEKEVETVTVRESREDKYRMIDRSEDYSCVPLTSPHCLLPAPDLTHLSQHAKERDSFHILLFTLQVKTLHLQHIDKVHTGAFMVIV